MARLATTSRHDGLGHVLSRLRHLGCGHSPSCSSRAAGAEHGTCSGHLVELGPCVVEEAMLHHLQAELCRGLDSGDLLAVALAGVFPAIPGAHWRAFGTRAIDHARVIAGGANEPWE